MSFNETFKKIEANNIEEHERILNEKFLDFQLEFVKRIQNKKTPFPEEINVDVNNIEDCFKKLTNIIGMISNAYHTRTHAPFDNNETDYKFEEIKETIFKKIRSEYEKNNDISPKVIIDIIDSVVNELPVISEVKTDESKEVIDKKPHQAGLINYGERMIKESDYAVPKEVLEKYNIDKKDSCIIIHLKALFKQKFDNKNSNNIFSSGSLKTLAQQIVSDYPDVRLILGKSWLMETPIAKKVGFNVYEKNSKLFGEGFWGQFVDQNGQLNEERANYLLENGRPPFKVSEAYIPVEDFLKKYLPEEEKNSVVLKKYNKDFEIQQKKDDSKAGFIASAWKILSEQRVTEELNSTNRDKEYFSTEEGKKMFNLILDFKRNGKTYSDVREAFIEDGSYGVFRKAHEEKNMYIEYTPDLL